MKQKLLSLFFVLTCLIGVSMAQNRQVSGKVTSVADGTPLSGVSVSVVGTSTAVQTDGGGNYTITVGQAASLSFSFVGYSSQRISVGSKDVINVQLSSEDNALEEVIVTAYGVQTKESVTGSIATIKAKDLAQVQTGNAIQSLAGKISGAQIRSTTGQPGSEPTVRFRGLGSISSSNNPLYVVDGVPYNGDIASISSQDIEEISFLKDAAANALYGSRGANGVIIITTKKGRGNVEISFETRGGYNSRAVKDYDIIKDPAEYMELRWQRLRIGYMAYGDSDTDARQGATNDLFEDLGINPFNVANDAIVDPLTGKINPSAKLLYQDDWSKYLFKNSFRQEHNLNIRYGNDKVTTYLSGGYLKDNGYVVNSGFDRASARANVEFKPYDFLKVGTNLNYAGTKMKNPQAGKETTTFSNLFSWTRSIAPIYPIFARDASGNILRSDEGRELYDWGRGETVGSLRRPYIANMNPYATTLLNTQTNSNANLGLRAFASIDFLNDFNFTYNLSYDYLSGNRFRYGTEEGGDDQPYGGSITNATIFDKTLTNQQFITYKKTFGLHDLNIMVGHEVSDYKSEMLAGTKTNLVIPNNVIIGNASKYSSLNGYNDNYKVEGYLSRVNYNYNSKYYASASFRRDGSSVFHPDHRWGNFFGLGGAWIISKEDFLQNHEVISNLKFKV
ncbi:MAG: SusC/RagA family TonB-linked outer membrane protein, partial [Sphingobacterium sp.]|nr:SusC/RagA family TonB-linked outer membrane protein [Sphingobacterium sp.]